LPKLTVRLPGDLEAIVYRCLEKDPARRFQNTAELAEALAKYAQSETQAAITVQRTRGIVGSQTFPPALQPGPGGRVPSTLSNAAGARTSSSPRGRRWPALAVMGVVIVGTVVVITAVRGGGSADGPSPSAQPEGASKALPASPPDRIERSSPPKPPSPAVATETTSPPAPAAAAAAPPSQVTAPPPDAVVTTPSLSQGSATTAQGSAGAPAQAASPSAAQARPPSSGDATIPSSTVAKKRQKATTSPVTSTRPGSPSTNPSPRTEDGVLDSRK
jgi:serine/threonine-protein kinase